MLHESTQFTTLSETTVDGEATTASEKPTLTKESRALITKALRAENALRIEDAVARVTGNHVLGKMIRQGVFYESKGELGDGRIHKTKREWSEEIGASRRQVDTANRLGEEWGLFGYEPGYRPRDSRPTGLYDFDLFAIMQVAFPAVAEKLEPELEYLEADFESCPRDDEFRDDPDAHLLADESYDDDGDHVPMGHLTRPERTPYRRVPTELRRRERRESYLQ